MAVGLVDQGSRGGGGKIWRRNEPSGGGGSGGGGGGSGVGSNGGSSGVNGSGGGVNGGSRRPVSASFWLACGVGQRRWIVLDTLNILMTFGYYLASFLASVNLLVSQKETNIWLSIRATNKKTYTQIKNGHFVMCICVLVQRNHHFLQNEYTKDGCKGK